MNWQAGCRRYTPYVLFLPPCERVKISAAPIVLSLPFSNPARYAGVSPLSSSPLLCRGHHEQL